MKLQQVTRFITTGLIAITPTVLAFNAAKNYDRIHASTLNSAARKTMDDGTGDPLTYAPDPLYDFELFDPVHGSVMTGSPVTVYYIFYGNFSSLEIDRITNYAKHVSDPETKPAVWSLMTRFTDPAGNRINKKLQYGGFVQDTSYGRGYNISTTFGFVDPLTSDLHHIMMDHIGNGKRFPFDPQGIYAVVSPPEVRVQECPKVNRCYGAYHTNYTTVIDGKPQMLISAFAPALTVDYAVGDLDIAPNGDTGRKVVDFIVQAMHHEIQETVTDPLGDGWLDASEAETGAEVGDVCAYAATLYPGLRFTESTLEQKGQYYNTIINGQKYAIQNIFGFDEQGIPSCYAEARATRYNKFKSLSVAVNPVTASDGIKDYHGPIHLPCKGWYDDRHHAGYHVLGGDDVCHTFYQGYSNSLFNEATGHAYYVNATLDYPKVYHVLSHNHAHYEWRRDVDESKAIQTFDDDVNVPLATADGKVFVIFQDNWAFNYTLFVVATNQIDNGAFYWCRALVNGIWYVGETNKFMDDCRMGINGSIYSIPKTDESVAFLMKPAPKSSRS
ncbi:hypothetical protein HDU76_003866 [Blyttiomyces sp. JEL0837]|nr:hypothetical protein HDU76_003866 [Blyttiomyces sp. JEL0837]